MHAPARFAFAAALALALLSPASARDDGDALPVASSTASLRQGDARPPLPLLWKLTQAGPESGTGAGTARGSVYLLGSFHLLKPGDYPVSGDITEAFAAADRLVFEVPPEDLHDPATALKFLQAAGYAQGGALSEVLPPDVHEAFARVLARNGVPAAQFEAFEPWFVNLSLTMALSQSMGFSGEHGLDQHLMRAAADAGKPTGGLETIDDQIQALDGTPMEEQVAALSDFVSRPDDMPGLLADLHTAWRDADVAALDRMTVEEMQARTPETYRRINVVRNQAWLPQIRAMLDDGSDDVLVVVGALHLLGEDGLVAHLADAGYRVERVCSLCDAPEMPSTRD